MRRATSTKLFLSTSDFLITNTAGETVELPMAKMLVEARRVSDWNMALDRLIRAKWDLAAVKAFYEKQQRPLA